MAAQKKFDRNLLRRILSFSRPYRGYLIGSIALSILLAVLTPLRPYLIQYSIDHYIENKLAAGLLWITLVQLALLLLEVLLRFVFGYVSSWLGQSVVNDMRQMVHDKIIHQNLSYYDKTPIGTLTTRTIGDIEAINDIFSEGFISIIADLLTIITIIGVMFWTNWKLTLVSLSVFPLLILATYFFKESVNRSFKKVRNAIAQLNAFAQEHITGMFVVQSFATEEREIKKFKTINAQHRDAHIKSILAYSLFFPAVEIILAVALGLLVWRGTAQMMNENLSQGVIIAFIMYLNLLFRPLRMLADKFNTLQMGLVAGERVMQVLDSEEYQKSKASFSPQALSGQVSFKDVWFAYKADQKVLRGITFEVKAGEPIAIVGHTGAGKSSIITVLNGLYPIESGSILIDGKPLQDYAIDALRQQIGFVLQDVFLFSGSILDNITLRDPAISKEQVESVCKLLDMHDFIMQLPNHYHFDVKERGNTLSQGQRQLLSFARALVRNPAILVLDEATSSVDSESEILIQKAIEKMVAHRTAIVIAHRLSTIRNADKILVLDHGAIVERGNHAELLRHNGIYARMVHAAMENDLE